MKYLKSIDLFGSRFHLTLFNQQKYKTIIGGISSIISMFIILVFAIIYSKDFFIKSQPTITSSTISHDNYSTLYLNEKNILLAFRLEDKDGRYTNHTGKIFPKIYYFSSYRDLNDSNNQSVIKEEYLSFSLCSDKHFSQYNIHGGPFYCIEWDNKLFGGYWDNYFLYYFEIQLHFCPSGIYSATDNCTSMEELNKLFRQDNNWFFSVFYPIYNFNPLDVHQAVKITYYNYFFPLSHLMQKTDRLFLTEITMNDDQGIIFESNINKTIWVFDGIKNDFSFFSEDDLQTEGMSSKFYSMNLYMDKNSQYYHRTYMKIQEIIAFIGAIIKVVFFITNCLLCFINHTSKEVDILNSFFSLNQTSSIMTHSSNKFNIQNTQTPIISISSHIGTNPNQMAPLPKMVHFTKTLTSKTKKMTFTFGYLAKLKMRSRLIKNRPQKDEAKYYSLASWLIRDLSDAKQYFRLFKEMYFVKNTLFNSDQLIAMNQINRFNICSHSDFIESYQQKGMGIEQIKLPKVYSEFSNINMLNKTDAMIIKFLDLGNV